MSDKSSSKSYVVAKPKHKKVQPKKKISKKSHKKKCKDEFPICTTAAVTTNPITVFGATTAAVTIPLTLQFTGAGGVTLIVSGTCDAPVVTLFIPSLAGLAGAITSFTCVGGLCTTTTSVIGTPFVFTTPIVTSITLAGVPIIGAIPDTISVGGVTVTNVNVQSAFNGTAIVTGTLAQTVSFIGVGAPVDAATLAASLLTLIVPTCCAGTTVATAFAPNAAAVEAALTALLGVPILGTTSIAALFGIAFTAPLTATLTTFFALAEATIPVTLPIASTTFPFTLTVSDPALCKLSKCEQLCATASAIFASVNGVSLATASIPATFTITQTFNCLATLGTLPATVPLDLTDILADLGLSAPTIPSIFCADLPGSAVCIPVFPAFTITDNVTVCINHGDACCGINSLPGSASTFASPLINASASPFFNQFSSARRGCCKTCK